MEEYNISLTDANGNMKPFSQLTSDLRERFKGLTEAQKTQLAATLAGQEGMSGLLAIVNASDKDYNDFTEAINNSKDAAQDMADTMLDNLQGAVTILKSNLESAGIVIGNQLTPYIRGLAEWITTLVEKFNALDPSTQALITRIGVLAAVLPPLMLIGSKLINMFLSLKNGITSVFSGVSLFTQAMGYASKGMEDVAIQIGNIYPMFSRLKDAVAGISLVSVGVVAAIGVLVGAFATLWKTNEDFRNNITETFNRIKGSFERFADGVVQRINDLGFNFENITDVISTAWNTLCDLLVPVFEGAFQTISAVIDLTLNNILAIMDVFIGVFTGNWKQALQGVQSWITGFIDVFSRIGETILNTIGSIGSKLLSMLGLEEAAEQFQEFFSQLGEWFGEIPEMISGAADSVVTFFTETVPSAFDSAVNAIGDFVSNALQSVITFFTETVPTAFNNFVNVIVPNFINSVITFFQQLPYQIGFIIGQVLGNIYLFGSNLLAWAATAIPQFIESVISFIATLPQRIWEWLVNAYNNVVTWGTQMVQKGQETGQNFINTIIRFIQTLPERVMTFLRNLLTSVIAWGVTMVSRAGQVASQFVSRFVSFLRSLPSKVLAIIQQIPSKILSIGGQMYSAGRNILNNLWDGIKSVASGILDWFSGFASQIASFVSGIVDGFKSVVSGASEAKSAAKSVNGSHANGLDYVPFNGYIAELHKGERVLTAEENKAYSRGGNGSGGDTFNFYNTQPTPYEYARQMKRAKKELLEEI